MSADAGGLRQPFSVAFGPARPHFSLEMHRNSKLAILLLAGLAGLIIFAIVRLSAPARGMIGLGLQSYTNACAIFTVTNLGDSQIDYVLTVERKITNDWPNYQGRVPHIMNSQSGILAPKQVSTGTVPVMVYAPPYPWRLSVFCWRHQTTPNPNRNTMRFRAGLWLLRVHQPKLAQKFLFDKAAIAQVVGPQMEQ